MNNRLLFIAILIAISISSCSSPCDDGITKYKITIEPLTMEINGDNFDIIILCQSDPAPFTLSYFKNGQKVDIVTFTAPLNSYFSGIGIKKFDAKDLLSLSLSRSDEWIVKRLSIPYKTEWEPEDIFAAAICYKANLVLTKEPPIIDKQNCTAELFAKLQPRYWAQNGELMTVPCPC